MIEELKDDARNTNKEKDKFASLKTPKLKSARSSVPDLSEREMFSYSIYRYNQGMNQMDDLCKETHSERARQFRSIFEPSVQKSTSPNNYYQLKIKCSKAFKSEDKEGLDKIISKIDKTLSEKRLRMTKLQTH